MKIRRPAPQEAQTGQTIEALGQDYISLCLLLGIQHEAYCIIHFPPIPKLQFTGLLFARRVSSL